MLARFRLLCVLICAFLAAACSYHSRLSADIYPTENRSPALPVRLLLASDTSGQKYFVFKDYHLSTAVHAYKIDLRKGALIATADALGTLFSQVTVDKPKHATEYDYLVRLTYHVTDPRENSLESVQWLNYSQMPHLQTHVTLTFENPQTGEVFYTAYATRQHQVELNNTTAAALRAETASSLSLALPLTTSVYTQQMGERIKYTLSRDLRHCLEEIMQTLQADQAVFTGQ